MTKLQNLKNYYLENRLLCNCVILAVLFLINCFVQYFGFAIAVVIATLMITEDRKNGFSILIFCVPFVGIEYYTGFYCLAVCLVVYLVKNYVVLFAIEKNKINWPVFIALMAYIVYALLPIGDYNIQFFIKFASIVLFFLLLNLFVRYTDILNLKFNLNLLAFALATSCFFFCTYFISPFLKNYRIWYYGDFIRFTAFFTMNPNVLSMMCEICLSLLTFYMLQDKFVWTDILAYIIFAVIGLTTLSKTFLLLSSIMFVILIVYLLKKFKTKALWWLLGIFAVISVIFLLNKDFFMTYVGRFFSGWESDMDAYEQVIDVATTGRYKLWMTVLEYTFTHPTVLIFGRGLGAPLVATMSAHNFYISILYQMGIVGGLLFIGVFVALIVQYFKQNPHKVSKALAVPIVIMGLLLCAEDLYLYIY